MFLFPTSALVFQQTAGRHSFAQSSMAMKPKKNTIQACERDTRSHEPQSVLASQTSHASSHARTLTCLAFFPMDY